MKTDDDYRLFIASCISQHSQLLADHWLVQLQNVVNEDTRDIFPTEQYLDHIPAMLDELAEILENNDEDLALTNSLLERKAAQLGTLRHQQKASVNQLLREYDLLSEVLEEFIVKQSELYDKPVSAKQSIGLMAAVARIVRTILQSTVDSFVDKYMTTIKDQTDKIVSFNQFISHELKTPLQAAQLNMELLMENKDASADDAKELLMIQTSIQNASSLLVNIENLIANSDHPMQDVPNRQVVNVHDLVQDVIGQLSDTLNLRDVDIHCDEDLGEINTETAKLRLIMTNLISNAVKYRDPKKDSRKIQIKRATNHQDDQAGIVIEDNGLGIEEDMLNEVFKLRVRAHESQDAQLNVTGYGMGLYLVKEAITDLGGTIELTSNVGEGTRITLLFPRN